MLICTMAVIGSARIIVAMASFNTKSSKYSDQAALVDPVLDGQQADADESVRVKCHDFLCVMNLTMNCSRDGAAGLNIDVPSPLFEVSTDARGKRLSLLHAPEASPAFSGADGLLLFPKTFHVVDESNKQINRLLLQLLSSLVQLLLLLLLCLAHTDTITAAAAAEVLDTVTRCGVYKVAKIFFKNSHI